MSRVNFVPPSGDPRLEIEALRQRDREVEIRAEGYAQAHDGEGDRQGPAAAIRRVLERVRAAMRRRN
jgi:hypothetical protein